MLIARHAFANDPDKTFIVGEAEDSIAALPAPMQHADRVTMSGLLHHLDGDEAVTALRLARRALSPHGRPVALEGTFLVKQGWIAGRFVGLDRTPYTHSVIEACMEPLARRQAQGRPVAHSAFGR